MPPSGISCVCFQVRCRKVILVPRAHDVVCTCFSHTRASFTQVVSLSALCPASVAGHWCEWPYLYERTKKCHPIVAHETPHTFWVVNPSNRCSLATSSLCSPCRVRFPHPFACAARRCEVPRVMCHAIPRPCTRHALRRHVISRQCLRK